MDEQSILEQVKEFFRSFLALQIETVRGDIRAAEAKTNAVDTKVGAYRREILAEFHRLESKVDVHQQAIQQILDARLGAMVQKLGLMDQKLDLSKRPTRRNPNCNPIGTGLSQKSGHPRLVQ